MAATATATFQNIGTRVLRIEFEQEDDGRWIAEIPQLPGVLVYGNSKPEAHHKVVVLALRALADANESEHVISDSVRFEVA